MNGITVRRLTQADAAAYQALRLRGLMAHPEVFTSSAQEEANRPLQWAQERLQVDSARPHDFFLGAFSGDTLVGVVGLQGRCRTKERHNATVVGMYVAPEAAGRGIGRALMHALLRQVADLPALEQLDLTVTAGNDRAQALYTGCGFAVCGTFPRAIKVGERYIAKVHMVRRLR